MSPVSLLSLSSLVPCLEGWMMLCDIHSVWENLEFIHTYIHLGVVRVLCWDGEGGGYERE